MISRLYTEAIFIQTNQKQYFCIKFWIWRTVICDYSKYLPTDGI